MDQAWLAQLRRSCRSSILFFLLSYLELLMFIMLLFQIANHLYFYLEKNLLLLRGLEHHPSLEMLKCFFYYRIEDLYLWWQMCHVLLKFQFYSWLPLKLACLCQLLLNLLSLLWEMVELKLCQHPVYQEELHWLTFFQLSVLMSSLLQMAFQ